MKFLSIVATLAVTTFAFIACGASADDPPKSRSQIRADICHAAYVDLQYYAPRAANHSREYLDHAEDAYWFTENYCEPK